MELELGPHMDSLFQMPILFVFSRILTHHFPLSAQLCLDVAMFIWSEESRDGS